MLLEWSEEGGVIDWNEASLFRHVSICVGVGVYGLHVGLMQDICDTQMVNDCNDL